MLLRRLQRLAALTQGLALVGVGACNNTDSAREPLHINSPYDPDAGAVIDTTSDAAPAPVPVTVNSPPVAADAGEFLPHTMNAPPRKPPPPPPAKP